jgi:hypothetical protein
MQGKSNIKYIFLVWVCNVSYPACNAHAPYRHLWPVLLYHIFPHYLIKGTIFRKKKIIAHRMYVSIFSTIFFWNIFPHLEVLSEILPLMYTGLQVKYPLLVTVPATCRLFMKLNFLDRFFFNNFEYQISCKSAQSEAEFFRADRKTSGQTLQS